MVGLHYHSNHRIVEEFGDYVISTPGHHDSSFPTGTMSAPTRIALFATFPILILAGRLGFSAMHQNRFGLDVQDKGVLPVSNVAYVTDRSHLVKD
jgi:hypothetical protein